jgi:hypothetical protein
MALICGSSSTMTHFYRTREEISVTVLSAGLHPHCSDKSRFSTPIEILIPIVPIPNVGNFALVMDTDDPESIQTVTQAPRRLMTSHNCGGAVLSRCAL